VPNRCLGQHGSQSRPQAWDSPLASGQVGKTPRKAWAADLERRSRTDRIVNKRGRCGRWAPFPEQPLGHRRKSLFWSGRTGLGSGAEANSVPNVCPRTSTIGFVERTVSGHVFWVDGKRRQSGARSTGCPTAARSRRRSGPFGLGEAALATPTSQSAPPRPGCAIVSTGSARASCPDYAEQGSRSARQPTST
jgi:hypothetical protein